MSPQVRPLECAPCARRSCRVSGRSTNMKRIVRASAVVCAMALGACVGGSSASRAGLDRGPTLEGVDVDGIRDDIDAFIGCNYSTERQRRAASQLAAHFQKTILVDKSDRAALKRQSVLGARGGLCLRPIQWRRRKQASGSGRLGIGGRYCQHEGAIEGVLGLFQGLGWDSHLHD